MACEKLCKSHLIEISSVEPEKHQDSHGYTAKNLTMIVRQELSYLWNPPTNGSYLLSQCQPLAREIELLHPSMDKGGKRRDNCEYPWVHGGVLRVPAEWPFTNLSSMVESPHAVNLLKILKSALRRRAQATPKK
jgi:hypothetical protein